MSESVIADFVADVVADASTGEEPVRGRVVLSQHRLVFAATGGTKTVPLDAVFDVTVGRVPEDISEYFDDTVSVRYREDGTMRTAVVEAAPETVDRFGTLLYKARLEGEPVTLVHPVRIGGRHTEGVSRSAGVRILDDALGFEGTDGAPHLPLGAVVGVDRVTREVEGATRTFVRVHHVDGSRSVATDVTLDSAARLNVLGRYVRQDYGPTARDLREVDLSKTELGSLVALYSGGTPRAVLGLEGGEADAALETLADRDLIARESAPTITRRGRIVVRNRLHLLDESD